MSEVRSTVRLPGEMHERLKAAARRDHRSIHAQMLAYIERGLADPPDAVRSKIDESHEPD